MNDCQKLYIRWLNQPGLENSILQELLDIKGDKSSITDRFCRELEFGTGGLRGILGAGTNRINLYTIRKATQGLANYLNATTLPKHVAVAHDSRRNGIAFAHETARVLAANGITAHLYPRLEPTPALSWAVRYLGCGAGICITASHNPADYNGYKVYREDGCQINLAEAERISDAIKAVDCFADIRLIDYNEGIRTGSITYIPESCLDDFIRAVYEQRISDSTDVSNLKLVYTPLNGSGLECVRRLLLKLGITHLTVVPEQELPDEIFQHALSNPKIRKRCKGLELCNILQPDLLIATDPDCDRCGVAVPDGKGGYRLLTGNETGVILFDYICRARLAQGTMPAFPLAVTTIVSTDMIIPLAQKYGVELYRTLTGFKFIGEQISWLEASGNLHRYIFDSKKVAYLSSGHVRIRTRSMRYCLFARRPLGIQHGRTLLTLNMLYEEYGYYYNTLQSFSFEGESGLQIRKHIMAKFRAAPPGKIGEYTVEKIIDYNAENTGLPCADVLEYHLKGQNKLIIRPSGTEPKIKVYLSAAGKSNAGVEAINTTLSNAVFNLVKSIASI
ncbi:MAG: phospho-sugar mutase [Ruthenibacterium lactatiformans]